MLEAAKLEGGPTTASPEREDFRQGTTSIERITSSAALND